MKTIVSPPRPMNGTYKLLNASQACRRGNWLLGYNLIKKGEFCATTLKIAIAQ